MQANRPANYEIPKDNHSCKEPLTIKAGIILNIDKNDNI